MDERLIESCPFNFDIVVEENKNEVSPLTSLEDLYRFLLLVRKEGHCAYPWTKHITPFTTPTDFCYSNWNIGSGMTWDAWYPKMRHARSSVPQTLVCHDYKGGYQEDRWVNGHDNHMAYKFYNWSNIDIFVYFSHYFITIPPPGWVSAGHLHGVPVLGTVITEWKTGQALWNRVLDADVKTEWMAEVIAWVAVLHKFDGFLINIENIVATEHVPRLVLFLKTLKSRLQQLISTKTYVIWYDSVTVEGNLKWQNQLNTNNFLFFDACDGIFTNYTWTEQDLIKSKECAQERLHDVFVGVDVFGRDFYKGGGFHTDLAMDVLRRHGLSAAIFAFGWTEEAIPGIFSINDTIFWNKLAKFTYHHGTRAVPFRSDFNRGSGLCYYRDGVSYVLKSWYDLAKQSHQPFGSHRNAENTGRIKEIEDTVMALKNAKEKKDLEANEVEEVPSAEGGKNSPQDEVEELSGRLERLYCELQPEVVEYITEDAFNGGGCLQVTPPMHQERLHVPLFVCDLEVTAPFPARVVTKVLTEGATTPTIYLAMLLSGGRMKKVVLGSVGAAAAVGDTQWVSRKYEVLETGRVLEIGLFVKTDDTPYLVGEVSVG